VGSGPRGAPPLGWHLQQVTLFNIISPETYRTQPRPARAALLPRRPLCHSSRTKTQRMALLRCLRGSSGAGLRPGCLERNYVEEEAFQIFGPGI